MSNLVSEDRKNLPINKLKEIPKEWSHIQIKEAFDLGRGRVISKNEIRENFGIYPVFSSQSTNRGQMGSINTYDFDGEYITWTTDGAYAGTVFYRNGKFNCTNVCGTLKDNKKFPVDLRFVAAYLSTVAKNHVSYVGNPKLMNGTFAEIEFPLPTLPEQKEIASILISVNEVIENTQKQIDKLQGLKKATMNELLTNGIGHTEFKDSESGRIPKSWERRKLGELGKFSKGKGIPKSDLVSQGLPCLRYAEIYTDYEFLITELKSRIPKEIADDSKRLMLGDIVFAGSGETVEEIGKSVAYLSESEAYVGGDAIILTPTVELDSAFLSYQLNDDERRKQLRKMGQGSSVIHIYSSELEKLRLHIPPLPEQKKIVSTLSSINKDIETRYRKLQQIQSLKKSLMQDLLTGKVRVKAN